MNNPFEPPVAGSGGRLSRTPPDPPPEEPEEPQGSVLLGFLLWLVVVAVGLTLTTVMIGVSAHLLWNVLEWAWFLID